MWMREVESIAVSDTARNLGLMPGRNGSFSPCPACGAEKRGSSDRRGPIGLRRDNLGWRCHACGAGGSGVDLVSVIICGAKFKDATDKDRNRVRGWFEEKTSIVPPKNNKPKKPTPTRGHRPPVKEVHALWKSCFKLHQIPKDDAVLQFLNSRNLNLEALARTGIARVTPNRRDYDWPKWWPGGRSMTWRLVVPAFDAKGTFCSLHARAVTKTTDTPKTLWPTGYQAGGLFMPNRHAVKMMRGEPVNLEGLVVVEGITDFLKATSEAERESLSLAILAGTSGSFGSIGKVNIPDGLDIYIGTDPDAKGEEYAKIIQTQLGSRICYRLPLNESEGETSARP